MSDKVWRPGQLHLHTHRLRQVSVRDQERDAAAERTVAPGAGHGAAGQGALHQPRARAAGPRPVLPRVAALGLPPEQGDRHREAQTSTTDTAYAMIDLQW